MRFGFMMGILGGLLIAHAGYATIEYRGVLKIVEEEFSCPPMNVVVGLLLGLALCIWAALASPAKLKTIHPDSEENRVVSLPANLDFMIFNHRAKVFPSNAEFKLKKDNSKLDVHYGWCFFLPTMHNTKVPRKQEPA